MVLLAGFAATALLFLDFCDLAFDCGCRAFWLGAAEACNVHDPASRHCPWCSHGFWGGAVPFGAVLGAQTAAVCWPGRWPLAVRIAAVVAALPVVGGLAALAFGLASGYWA